MKKIILIHFILFSSLIMAQVQKTDSLQVEDSTIFIYVEQQPEFPGGMGEMMSFISKNVKYPEEEKKSGISGTVFVEFVVTKDGKVTRVKTKRGVKEGPGLEKEAERVIYMMPDWQPGKQNGKPINVRYTIPIKFSLKG